MFKSRMEGVFIPRVFKSANTGILDLNLRKKMRECLYSASCVDSQGTALPQLSGLLLPYIDCARAQLFPSFYDKNIWDGLDQV